VTRSRVKHGMTAVCGYLKHHTVILNLIQNLTSIQREKMSAYIYIMSNKKDGTLYIGVTSNLLKRVHEHKEAAVDSFTNKYNLKNLVYFEILDDISEAIKREKQLKNWKREWKVALIEKKNFLWEDLYGSLVAGGY